MTKVRKLTNDSPEVDLARRIMTAQIAAHSEATGFAPVASAVALLDVMLLALDGIDHGAVMDLVVARLCQLELMQHGGDPGLWDEDVHAAALALYNAADQRIEDARLAGEAALCGVKH